MLFLKSFLKIKKNINTIDSNAMIKFEIATLKIKDNGKIKTKIDNILFKYKLLKKILSLIIKNFFY